MAEGSGHGWGLIRIVTRFANFGFLRPIPTRRFLTTPIIFLIGRLLV